MAVSEQAVVTGTQLDTLCINTIRTLAIDAVQQANSGHPGAPMGLAPVTYCLWQEFLRYDPGDPRWMNRDRFVLSNGHASMLLYAMLHLAGVREVGEDDPHLRMSWTQQPFAGLENGPVPVCRRRGRPRLATGQISCTPTWYTLR